MRISLPLLVASGVLVALLGFCVRRRKPRA